MLWLFVGPTGVYLLDFFCSSIQLYYCWVVIFALSPFYILDLYVLGDDALISKGSFMQTKHLCVSIHNWTKSEVGAPLNRFKPSSKISLLTVPRRCFFCGSFISQVHNLQKLKNISLKQLTFFTKTKVTCSSERVFFHLHIPELPQFSRPCG